MQVPERLALIGGSILLASTLIFTLKSQASQVLPKISNSASQIYNHIGDAKKASDFDGNFQQAQKQGWTTGTWGSAKYYIDDGQNMHVGAGELQGNLASVRGDQVHDTKTLSFDQDVKAPQDSGFLLASSRGYQDNDYTLTTINGLDHVDTSQVENMGYMFGNDMALNHVDISNWNTSNVKDMGAMFVSDTSLTDLNVANLDVHNVGMFGWTFYNISVPHLDLSTWHPNDHANMMSMMASDGQLKELNINNFINDTNQEMHQILGGNAGVAKNSSLTKITIGQASSSDTDIGLADGQWKDGNTTLSSNQLIGDQSHAGTWLKQ